MKVEFTATTDAPTPVNLVHHPFFNLRGSGNGNILSHVLTINASATTPVDAQLIPTGEIVSVEGTPLDFREPHVIGDRIEQDYDQLHYGHGYDHNWVIDRAEADVLTLDAVLYEPESGRKLEVLSDQPGMQFYSGYFFADGATKDMFGNVIPVNGALALETQRFPDSIHHPEFGDTVLRPGGTYTHTCLYRFSAE